MKIFETIRHGEKNSEGHLSEEGMEHSRIKAKDLYERIKKISGGSVIYLMPSSVGRAIETRDVIESELRMLCEGEENIEFISIQDLKKVLDVSSDFTKKFIITELQATSSIGFDEKTNYLSAWKDYGKKLGNKEINIMTVWAAQSEELEVVRAEMQAEFRNIDASLINPKDFIRTPEEEALNYLRLSKRMGEITEKYFPGRPFLSIQIGHNPADFSVLALMGKEISANNLKELWNGSSRDFLESARFVELDGKVRVIYRSHDEELTVSIDDVIEQLKERSEKRKLSWQS